MTQRYHPEGDADIRQNRQDDLAQRYAFVKAQIEKSIKRFEGQSQSHREVALIAVSKTYDVEDIRPLILAGQRVFGENRVQEAQGKWPQLQDEFADLELHLIGPLQSNKVKDAVALFDVIESVDREKLARALVREMAKQNRQLDIFVQVNIGKEPQKAGVEPDDCAAFVSLCREELGLSVIGLMCIPPAGESPAPYFAQLNLLGEKCGVPQLSMGMSGDYEIAVQMGATQVRVGSALFGARN